MSSRHCIAFGVALAVVALASGPIGATAARLGLQQEQDFSGYFGRKLHQQPARETCLFGCAKLATCVTATCAYYNATYNAVTVSMGSCKGATISWFCCREASGTCSLDTSSCVSGKTSGGNTCNDLTSAAFFMLNTMHDGNLDGTNKCTNSGDCCAGAGNGNSCGGSGSVCDFTITVPSHAGHEYPEWVPRRAYIERALPLPLQMPPAAQPAAPEPSAASTSQPPASQPAPAPSSPAPAQPPASQPSPAPSSPAAAQPPSSQPAPSPSSPAAAQPPSSQPSPAPSSPAAAQPPASQPSPAPSSPAAAQPPSSQPAPSPSSPAAAQPPASQPSPAPLLPRPRPAPLLPARPAPSSPAAAQPPSSQPSPAPSSSAPAQPPSSQPAPAPSSPAAAQPPSSQPAPAPSSQPPLLPAPRPPPPPSPPPVAPVGDNTATPPPSPPACANDTLWAAPRSTGKAQPGTTVPTFKFTTGSPAASSSPLFTWDPLQTMITDAGSDKWGGYFTITTPSSGQTFTTATTATTIAAGPFGCAGCAKNDPRRGWDVGGVIIQVRAINATFVTASCSLLIRNNANVTAVVDQAHFYASYTPMPNFNPGQFPAATITGIPGAEGTNTTMTARVGGTKAANSSPIYLACHWGVAAC
ncbi:hypothetical protein HYH03_018019 [Edaphochlamys debaryana]|uniref:Uncharacterized protein n=1 Tax=Edaphochlamys debaryana TaxID=47281 RepID=A0A835XFE4_9CHLO|nr:hypothetical protein HYH03_018019 [Edaphochlamys debaryana]|eukprot:KAG2483078.1 hypothetical protein HYH03_018019 [Edaphochlamys debaryana]